MKILKKYNVVFLNLLILIFGIIGLCFTVFSDGFMNKGAFMYYTVQSNLFAMLTAAIVAFFEYRRRKGKEIPPAVQHLRLISTIAITLTFLVFSVMLTPEMIRNGDGDYLTSPSNIFVHNLVPIGAILDWCFFGSAKELKKGSFLFGMVPAFMYVCYVYICVVLGLKFSEDAIVPYFFLDYQTYGWFRIGGGLGVVYWIVILAGVLVGLGYAFSAIAARREKHKASLARENEGEKIPAENT